jgi:hypothetical protein
VNTFIIPYVHPLADGTSHTRKTNTELGIKLLAYGPYAAIAQVIDIVDLGTLVHQGLPDTSRWQ